MTTTTILPPGISAATFDRALKAFAQQLGEDAVLTGAAQLQERHDPFAFGNREQYAPSAVVMPECVEQVQAAIRLANEYRIPLWTVSQGRNLGYGGAAPRLRGSVILELRRMNRVLAVDEESGYAVVEPGVRFFDLYEQLDRNRWWMSAPALGWGSVIGNALERGLGLNAYADHETNICGMEVVLPTGELLRTGMGAMENSCAWHINKAGFGPSADGLFMQSNFGVVTRMGMLLMPTPECFRVCEVKLQNESDLGPLVETLRPFKIDGTIPGRAITVNAIRIAQGVSHRRDWYDKPGAVPDDIVRQMQRKLNVGHWNLVFGLYGSEEVVEAQLRRVQRAFGSIPGAEFVSRKYPGNAIEPQVAVPHKAFAGIPGLEHLNILGWAGPEGAHLGFSPISPMTATHALRQATMVRATAARYGFDYGTAFGALGRRLNHVFMIVFDRTDAEETARAHLMFEALVKEGAAEGYAEYRTHLAYMDLVAQQYGFNDHAQLRFNERLKDVLDPNGILAPGKQGIWPQRYREKR